MKRRGRTKADTETFPDEASGTNRAYRHAAVANVLWLVLAGLVLALTACSVAAVRAPVVTITAVPESGSRDMLVQFLVGAQPPPAQPLTVTVRLNATGCTLVSLSEKVKIAGGDSAATLTLTVTTGGEAGSDGCTVTATIAPGAGYAVSDTEASATATRTGAVDADPVRRDQPMVTIAAAGGSVTEGSPVRFTVTATPAPAAPLQVSLMWMPIGSVLDGTPPATVTISTDGTAAVEAATDDDEVDEPNGAVIATVTSGPGYTVGEPRTARVAVIDNDGDVDPAPGPGSGVQPMVTIAAAGGSVTEGSPVRFTLTATPAPAAPLQVSLTWAPIGSVLDGTPPATVTISTDGTAAVEAATDDDEVDEPNGTVIVTVTSGPGYTVADPRIATAAVVDNDGGGVVPPGRQAVVTITAHGGPVTEGSPVRFTLTATPAPASPLQVALSWAETVPMLDGTPPATVTIPVAGTASVEAATDDDEVDDLNGTVIATVTSGPGYAVGEPRIATVAVIDNDVPVITIAADPDWANEGSPVRFTLTATPAPAAPVQVALRWADDVSIFRGVARRALAGTPPAAVTIPVGGTASLEAATDEDEVRQNRGKVTATVSSGPGYAVGDPKTATVAVFDRDATVSIKSLSPDPVGQGQNLYYTLEFRPHLSEAWHDFKLQATDVTQRGVPPGVSTSSIYTVDNPERTLSRNLLGYTAGFRVPAVNTANLISRRITVSYVTVPRGYVKGDGRTVTVTW